MLKPEDKIIIAYVMLIVCGLVATGWILWDAFNQ